MLSGNNSDLVLIQTSDKRSMVFNSKIHMDSSFLLERYVPQIFIQDEVAAIPTQELYFFSSQQSTSTIQTPQ